MVGGASNPATGLYLFNMLDVAAGCLSKGVNYTHTFVEQIQKAELETQMEPEDIAKLYHEESVEEKIERRKHERVLTFARQLKKDIVRNETVNRMLADVSEMREKASKMGCKDPVLEKVYDDLVREKNEFNEFAKRLVEVMNEKYKFDFVDFKHYAYTIMLHSGMSFQEAFSAKIDPLVFDLGNDGFDIQKKKDGTYFDLNCDGFAEKVNWTSTDAILAIDVNGNGVIDDGSEVFGDRHLMNDGKIPETDYETVSTGIYNPYYRYTYEGKKSRSQTRKVLHAKSGFEALAQYDVNDDGIIDKNDNVYEKLLLWVDANNDGMSQKEELKTLEELGISSIDLNYLEDTVNTNSEAVMKKTSSFTYENGTTGKFGEMWVAADLFDTVEKEVPDIAETIQELPDVRGFGKVSSLHVAIARDKTGKLENLVREFLKEPDRVKQYKLVDDILDILCNVEQKNHHTREENIEERKIIVVEQIMGMDFIDNIGSIVPNPAAAPMIGGIYQDIVETYYYSIIGGEVKKYFDCILNP